MTAQKRVLIFGTVYFVGYLIAALCFFKERIFLDGAYYFFHVVQSENFRIEHQRFILIPSQLLAWGGVKLHLSLRDVLLLNSINPVLYLWGLFTLCILWLKDVAASWALLLLSVCGIYFLYFCPMYEVWYGAALLILFNSFLCQKFYQNIWQLFLLGLITITLLFSYPLMIVGALFFVLYHFIEEKRIPIKVAGIFCASLIIWSIWKIFFISEYESGKIGYPYSQIANTVRSNFHSIKNILLLLKFLFTTYSEEVIMMVASLLVLLARGKHLKALIIFLFVSGFILIINLTHPQPWNHTNYYERIYLLLVPMCVIPFLREVYQYGKMRVFFEFFFMAIIAFRGAQIVHHSRTYEDRIELIEQLVQSSGQEHDSKFYIDDSMTEYRSLREWSLPMEALIFSSLDDPHHSIVISLKSDLAELQVASMLNESTFHLRLDEIMKDDWLNRHYFYLEDGNYQELKIR